MLSLSSRQSMRARRLLSLAAAALMTLAFIPVTSPNASAQSLTGLELLRISRIAHGGAEYAGLQNVTAQSEGFVNMAPFGAFGLGTGPAAAAVEMRFRITDYQGTELRRRLEVRPTGPSVGETFLVHTGTQGGGMFMGNEFRISETAASRHWAMLSFSNLNMAADGQFPVSRERDETVEGVRYYVAEVRLNPQDTVRYYINPTTFLIGRVVTRYNNRVMVQEDRSEYRKVGCLMLPFRVVTYLSGQRLADLTIASYDVETVVPAARFTLTATPQ